MNADLSPYGAWKGCRLNIILSYCLFIHHRWFSNVKYVRKPCMKDSIYVHKPYFSKGQVLVYNNDKSMEEEKKKELSIYRRYCTTPSVGGETRNSAPDLRRSGSDCRLMTTPNISVVASAVSPPLLTPQQSAIEPCLCVRQNPHLPVLSHVLYNLFKVWQILPE